MAVDRVTRRAGRALAAAAWIAAAGCLPLGCSPAADWAVDRQADRAPDRQADRAADRAALLRLHEEQRVAHVAKDAELLVSSFSDSFLSIEDGDVGRPARAEAERRFASYLESVELLEWEDIEPPVIRISADGTMAYVVVRKRVRLVPIGGGEEEHTVYAWLETWEKGDGEWKLTAVASTDRPGMPPAEPTPDGSAGGAPGGGGRPCPTCE